MEYTDQCIQEMMTSVSAGERNSAPHLMRLDTPTRRARAVSEARTLTNIVGFRHSDAVRNAVENLLLKIERGQEDQELFGESYARTDRERQARERELRMYRI